jgi:hypothetical protein
MARVNFAALETIEQRRAKREAREAREFTAARKARDREIYKVGGLVSKVGLLTMRIEQAEKLSPDDGEGRSRLRAAAVYGALLTLQSGTTDQKTIDRWIKAGLEGFERETASLQAKVSLAIKFETKPPASIISELRSHRLTWGAARGEWSGVCDPVWATEIASSHGGQVEVLSAEPASPLREAAE